MHNASSSRTPPSALGDKPRGANRSTKVAGKLKVLPEQPEHFPVLNKGLSLNAPKKPNDDAVDSAGKSEDGDIESSEDNEQEEADFEACIYNQISLIPDGTARRDALRLTKKKAKSLPRVTAYATASSYKMNELMKFFNARRNAYHASPKLIDEVIYTPYIYEIQPKDNDSRQPHSGPVPTADLLEIPELRQETLEDDDRTVKRKRKSFFNTTAYEAEIFMFQYGTVVIWGMTEAQERRFLASIKRFEIEKLAPESVEMEDLNYYYANYSRIYNDVITLREGSSYMTKLSLSHALSQSVKISLFEELISSTIEETKDIPEVISETGKIGMPHKEIMQQIGQLFLLRTNINSVGSVLDSPFPNLFLESYPDLQPLYDAARSYLEIPQRINLLNTRVEVLQDMLQLLKESVSSKHAERLEQIVIVLIAIEIVLGIITILVDLMA
ncbi:Sporulation protein RMD1 [Leucoagaricus sp. SymC.cos]|nr:Sporulation protein RMD1 [Leucoagaricus sp. SymC.cos]